MDHTRRRATADTRVLDPNALYAEEVARARAMSPADKLLEGPRLFERACRLMADGIRHRHPDLDDEGVRVRLGDQLQRLRALDER